MKLLGLAALVATLLVPRAALAADVEPIHIFYVAPAQCPSEEAFIAAVRATGGAFREADPAQIARDFDVMVQKTNAGFSGSITVRAPSGAEHVRSVTCGRCAPVLRALALIAAMALADGPRAALPPSAHEAAATEPADSSPDPDISPEPETQHASSLDDRDENGGVAAMAVWGRFAWSPTGAEVMAVRPGGTRIGAVAALTAEQVTNESYVSGSTPTLASSKGFALRAGAVASWGAPWSHDDWVGFALEAGLRGSVLHGTTWPIEQHGTYCATSFGSWSGEINAAQCISGPGTPTTWLSLWPYLSGTFVVQLAPKSPLRPFVATTLLWSGDYHGASSAWVSLQTGLAWRSW